MNAKDNDGWIALMGAAGKGHTEAVRILIDAGADVNAETEDGDTALAMSSDFGRH